LTNLAIGSAAVRIDTRFSACYKLTTITVAGANAVYDSIDGAWLNKSHTTLIQCPEGKTASFTVPAGVTSIGDNAFADCNNLTIIQLADSVTNIGDRAFCYCERLSSITIPNLVGKIGADAFRGCTSLTNVMIGRSLADLGSKFSGCDKLT